MVLIETKTAILWSLMLALLLSPRVSAYLSPTNIRRSFILPRISTTAHHLDTLRDADSVECMVGGERYEMVPLPDSMMDTTLFVGNLNEFAQDGDLSNLFQHSSTVHSLPACVARKANYYSLEYGFVAFPTVEQKEVRMIGVLRDSVIVSVLVSSNFALLSPASEY